MRQTALLNQAPERAAPTAVSGAPEYRDRPLARREHLEAMACDVAELPDGSLRCSFRSIPTVERWIARGGGWFEREDAR